MSSFSNWPDSGPSEVTAIPAISEGRPAGSPAAVAPRRHRRRLGTRALLALALVTGGVGGGAVGAVASTHWLTPRVAQAAAIRAQPIAQTTQAAANVAGAVLQTVGPSVVEVETSSQVGFRQGTATGIGSGFVIDTSGLILTNNHVVDDATTVTVRFSTGDTHTATVLGTDSANDLALLRVSDMPGGIAAVQLGDSSQVEVGE
ncbi:MAG TPA: trypsin-like peptidase domain-containing protein, partial [Herpetosiphonaceae bacterium]|nr:trypsin-like peptidase domain-containing protein [Herpetosiphonaceae bacterium]